MVSQIYRSLIIKACETSPDEGDDDDGIITENQQRPPQSSNDGTKSS